MAGFQAQMADVPGQLAALQLQVNAMQAAQEQMQAVQQHMHRNTLLRLANSQARLGDVPLQVISKESTGGVQPLGAQPAVQPDGSYPATSTQLRELTHAQLDNLAAFYHEHFGISAAAPQPGQATTPILQRRRMFALFVGFPQP